MQIIFFSKDFTLSFSNLGNLWPSNPKALSITDLLEAKLVLNFFCAKDIFDLTLYGVMRWFDNG